MGEREKLTGLRVRVRVSGGNSVRVQSSELDREGVWITLELWQQTRHPSICCCSC